MTEVVGAFLVRDGLVLLGLRSPSKRYYPDVWDCIGGHLEPGETRDEALVRELIEEIGVVPTIFTALGDLDLQDGMVCRLYRVDAWAGGEPALANAEHVDLRWSTVEEACALPNLALAEYRAVLRTL